MSAIELQGVRLAGLATTVPSGVVDNATFSSAFSEEEAAAVSKTTGVSGRRVASSGTCASDLCEDSAKRLLSSLGWEPDTVGALVFVSQTPDQLIPPTACLLQERLGLPTACAAFDVTLGCSGYVYGLWIAGSLLSDSGIQRVLLLVGDTITRLVSPSDRSTALLFGDAGSATALEHDASASPMTFVLGTDGSGANSLEVRGGAFRAPAEAPLLTMDGGEVFAFTLRTVPRLVKAALESSGLTKEEVDAFVLHQANAFMVEHLRKRLRLPEAKTVLEIDGFGNTTSASIPLAMTEALSDRLCEEELTLHLAGFGVGLSWGAVVLRCGPAKVLRPVEFQPPLPRGEADSE